MLISIGCPACAAKYRVSARFAGKRIKCKKCAFPIVIPAALADAVDPDIKLKPEEEPESRPKPPPLPAIRIGVGEAIALREPAPPPRQTIARPRAQSDYGSGKKPIRASTAAPEGFSSMLLFVYVLIEVLIGIYQSMQQNVIASHVWSYIACDLICFFGITAPILWAGLVTASKLMRYELAEPAYVKGAAIAISPALMVVLDAVLPIPPAIKILGLLCILPFTYVLTMLLFSLRAGECAATYGIGLLALIAGRFLQMLVISAIILGSLTSEDKARIAANGMQAYFIQPPAPPKVASDDSPTPTPQASTPGSIFNPSGPQSDFIVQQLNRLEDEARNMTRPDWMNNQSREQMTAQLNSLQTRAEAVRLECTTDERKSKFQELAAVLQDAGPKIAALSSESPDESIYQPITETTTWQPSPGDPTAPVSFRGYRIDLPTDAKVDLRCIEDSPEGLSWELPATHGRFTITTAPRPTPRQQRPWVMTHSYMKPAATDIFTVQAVNIPVDISYGQINGSPATRIATRPSDTPNRFARRWIKYVIANGKDWLIITAAADDSDARTLSTLENSAWSVHPARSDEPRIDPFSIDALIARLPEDRAADLIRKMGSTAEPALLKHLDDTDLRIRGKAIALLGDVGTQKSVPALLALAQTDNHTYTDIARKALRKLSPGSMDDVDEALLDLNSKDHARRQQAVTTLAMTAPKADEARRPKVSQALTDLILDRNESFGLQADTIGDAVANWQSTATVPMLLPLLDHDANMQQRELAMTVLARTKDKRAVFLIIRWLIEDTESASKALISMGPVAEDDLIKVLGNKNETARLAACKVLGEIGGKKSLKPLDNLVYYKDGPKDAAAGNAAIAQIKDRLATPATPATPANPGVPAAKPDDGKFNPFPNAQ